MEIVPHKQKNTDLLLSICGKYVCGYQDSSEKCADGEKSLVSYGLIDASAEYRNTHCVE